MITLKVKGDLIQAFKLDKFDGIVHGCNAFCNMGAGIAKTIAKSFPSAFKADQTTEYGDRTKLGTYSKADTKHGLIINAYTQYHYGFGKMNCDYEAIEKVFTQLNKDFPGKTFGIPKIGCGLADGSWKTVKKIIDKVTPDINIEVYYL